MCLRSILKPLAVILVILFPFISPLCKADSLSIDYLSSQDQTATVGPGFTPVVFSGYVVNNTNTPITFQLTGGPVPFEPYVAGFVNGIGYPGITLAGGQSTGIIDLATVNLQPFDRSLTYPGLVNIVLDAISVDPITGHTGGVITENDATIHVQTVVPEPPIVLLLTSGLLAMFSIYRRRFA